MNELRNNESMKKGTPYYYSSFDRIDARESVYLYVAESQIPDSGNGLYTAIPIWKNEIISFFKVKSCRNTKLVKELKREKINIS